MTLKESQDDSSARLQCVINTLGISNLKFANAIGVSQSFVSLMVKGKSKISRSAIDKIGKAYPKVNIHWLITGEGEMFFPDSAKPETRLLEESTAKYQKSNNAVLFELGSNDDVLRKRLGINLDTARKRWGMKKSELFRMLVPDTAKQTVTNYFSGASQPPLIALIRLESMTGIPISTWLTKEISASDIPPAPVDGAVVMAASQAETLKKELRALLDRLG